VSYWTVENEQFLLQMSLPYYTGICLVVRLMMCCDGLTSPLYAFTLCDVEYCQGLANMVAWWRLC